MGHETEEGRNLHLPYVCHGLVGGGLHDMPVSNRFYERKTGFIRHILDGCLGCAKVAVHELKPQFEELSDGGVVWARSLGDRVQQTFPLAKFAVNGRTSSLAMVFVAWRVTVTSGLMRKLALGAVSALTRCREETTGLIAWLARSALVLSFLSSVTVPVSAGCSLAWGATLSYLRTFGK